MMKRYFVSRQSSTPEGGVWKVFDRKLKMIYASCEFKEQANNIKDALNKCEEWKVEIPIKTTDDRNPT